MNLRRRTHCRTILAGKRTECLQASAFTLRRFFPSEDVFVGNYIRYAQPNIFTFCPRSLRERFSEHLLTLKPDRRKQTSTIKISRDVETPLA